MSEYQYYEFRAIDRALTDRQMRELRFRSTSRSLPATCSGGSSASIHPLALRTV